MKCKQLIGALVVSAVCCACNSKGSAGEASIEIPEAGIYTSEDNGTPDPESERRTRDHLTLVKYLKLVDEQYVLDISEEDAVKLGVSKESYKAACEDIVRENANIRKAKEEGRSYSLEDPQEHLADYEKAEAEYMRRSHDNL